ncbi:hypothetical protein XNC1_2003 [Xenorhabdus nematophila ATCC 19061]|uniref:Uncharacterized protein n=1 Tax=Xenorhabdus nematophila (strain ATCC 19061 / DSM 3370 / CCUG 14189 / LMG 1036 / NCIMB 9965 / AN6) TaxID=406817 RepID=D3VDZ6_XENNA|nr:hypothetical protein XNC1_2003 [Xenorhabdus nematophila ATCC 19061]CEK22933.1 hypothetical protein XNC2_1939 [Xenorhabdus nematophila AN6/1]
MIDRTINNTSTYDIEVFVRGTANSQYYRSTVKAGGWEWVFIEGNELFSLNSCS